MNNYNIVPVSKKKIGDNITKTTINITNRGGKHLTFQDIANITNQLNKNMNPKYNSKFLIVASTPFTKGFNIKAYNETNIRYSSIEEYLAGRVKETTKFTNISQISIVMVKERIVK